MRFVLHRILLCSPVQTIKGIAKQELRQIEPTLLLCVCRWKFQFCNVKQEALECHYYRNDNIVFLHMYTPEDDVATNLNIRISRNLKNLSSSLLQNIGVSQSQYIRDALQYIIDHNALPWQRSTANTILYRYASQQNQLYVLLNQLSQGYPTDVQQMNTVCAYLDDLNLHSTRVQDDHLAQGITSIPLSKLNGLFIQLTSLFRYNGSMTGAGLVYPPIVVNQMRYLAEQIDITIRSNNL